MASTDASTDARPDAVEFFFDPMCPYAYQTSRWIRSVRDELRAEGDDLDITWRFFSLEDTNLEPGKKHPWERAWSYGWSQMRIGAWLRRQSQDAVDRWYLAVGEAFHDGGRPTQEPDVHREVLAEAGLDPAVLDEAIADPTTSDEVRADHDFATRELGGFGVPIMRFDDGGPPVFGPVVVPAPTGAEAVRLWDATLLFRTFDGLWELKRPKTRDDLVMIAERFEPYLRARSWRTIERPAP